MTRALVLSSGLSSAAYQIGALRHLVQERGLRFEVCAGTGLGAINAAFVACAEFAALQSFWQQLGWRRLVGMNWRSPWRHGPLSPAPLKRFLAQHISEEKLKQTGALLCFNCLNLQTGREDTFVYPGYSVPLVEALSAAFGVPGLTPPLQIDHRQWVDASYVNSFMLRQIVRDCAVDEVWAIATAPIETVVATAPRQHYPNWRAVAGRGLQLNQAHDVWSGLSEARELSEALAAHQHVRTQLPDRLAGSIEDADLREQVRRRITHIFDQSAFPLKQRAPIVQVLTPSRPLQSSAWRFRRDEIQGALQLGEIDARALP